MENDESCFAIELIVSLAKDRDEPDFDDRLETLFSMLDPNSIETE